MDGLPFFDRRHFLTLDILFRLFLEYCREPERASFANYAMQPDGAAHEFRKLFCDRKSQSRPAILSGR